MKSQVTFTNTEVFTIDHLDEVGELLAGNELSLRRKKVHID